MVSDTGTEMQEPRAVASPGMLQRIPLLARMLVYGAGFLGVVLGAVPWLFYQIDVLVPSAHVELGPLRWVGAALAVACLALYISSSFVLTYQGKGAFVEFDPPTELVISGPYRFVRNPVVAFLLGTMLGEAIAFSSTGIALMFCVFVLLSQLQVRRIEEPLLRERYGTAYEEYCQRVPRWIPRWPRES